MDNREAALRCELAAAIKHRKEAEAVANEAKARLDRGKTLQEQVEAEVNTLENSQREFHSKCEQDRTFAILANLEHEHAGDIGDVVTLGSPTIDTAALISAKDKASACRNAVAKLNADFSDANDKANRATQACETLVEAIIFITVENAANEAVAAQEAAWAKLDCLRGACELDAKKNTPRTHALQQHVDRKLDRFKHTVDETGTPMDTKDWRDFQMAKAKAHESAWLNFAARLTDDADAIFTTGGNS